MLEAHTISRLEPCLDRGWSSLSSRNVSRPSPLRKVRLSRSCLEPCVTQHACTHQSCLCMKAVQNVCMVAPMGTKLPTRGRAGEGDMLMDWRATSNIQLAEGPSRTPGMCEQARWCVALMSHTSRLACRWRDGHTERLSEEFCGLECSSLLREVRQARLCLGPCATQRGRSHHTW